MKIVKFNNKQIFPSLINEFFNDDFGVNFLNRNHSVPSVNTIENDDSFEIDLAVPGMKKDDFSIELDNKNTFFKQINNVNSGIYRIEHLPEYQNILVDKGDSIWIRVNAEDFSESLSFTGKGSSKNNFLIDIYNFFTLLNYIQKIWITY